MKKTRYLSYEDNNVEILIDPNEHVFIKDKLNKNYFTLDNLNNKFNKIEWHIRKSKISSFSLYIYISIFIVILAINIMAIFNINIKNRSYNTLICINICIYSIINILAHECAHVLSLKHIGRDFGKIGFKFNYIFPSFYVNMNEVYMLTRKEKIIVHSAGLFINSAINIFILLLYYFTKSYIYIQLFYIISVGIFYNAIPLLNSDGYKIITSIFYFNEYKNKSNNPQFIKFILIFNKLFCIVYTLYFIYSNVL